MTSLADPDDIVTAEIPLEVADEELPEQDVFYTNWFHCDCLCDLHHVELYSDEFYAIFDEYIRNMTEHRQNTLLLPGVHTAARHADRVGADERAARRHLA